MRAPFAAVVADRRERSAARPGDDLVAEPDVVMDRGVDLPAPPEQVWPWLVQLGKRRAGWYLPRRVERRLPRSRRALRHLEPSLQGLAVGEVIPDWGGRDASFTLALLDPPHALVHTSRRGRTDVSWALFLTEPRPGETRLQLRLRLGPVKHPLLARTLGEAVDRLTVLGLASGLAERVRQPPG